MTQLRVVVVVNWKRGSVYGITTDNEEARRWTRELCDQERDGLAASMTVALVDLPAGDDVVQLRSALNEAADVAHVQAIELGTAEGALEWQRGKLRKAETIAIDALDRRIPPVDALMQIRDVLAPGKVVKPGASR